jgi:mannose-6-phosphate isomerase-like protein (cupin superfamily)
MSKMINNDLIEKIKKLPINLTEDSILEKLLDRRRWPKQYLHGQPSVEAILDDGSKHQDFFNNDLYLSSEKCIECYEEGYTLILSSIGGISKDVWIIQQLLNSWFGTNISLNFYLGNGKKSISFEQHKHDYPVIIKNVYGESTWMINNEKKTLKDQDVIWFDKNVNHQVLEIQSPKLSLTCNIEVDKND